MSSKSSQVLLLVDGYNVIGTWSELKKTRDRHGLESARQELIEVLINYTAIKGYETQVVFDAHYQKTPSYSESHTPEVSVYYTAFAETADTYIEKFCATFNQKKYQHESTRLIVATSDRAQQLTVIGYGAEWRSAQMLAGEVDKIARKIQAKRQTKKKPSGRFLFHTLDPAAQKRLRQMQRGIQ